VAVHRGRRTTGSSGGGGGFYMSGGTQLKAIHQALKEFGAKDLRNELNRGATRSVRPVRAEVRRAARVRLPKRGGLAKRVAASKITTRRVYTGRSAGVSLRVTSNYHIGTMNRGIVRHPVFGNEDTWTTQIINRGWWNEAIRKTAPGARREMQRVINEIAGDLAKRMS
jgi:hypothetical protein